MTTNYHTDHAFGAPLSSAEVNAPLGQLDAAIGVLDGNWTVVHCTADGVTDNAARIQAAADVAGYGETIFIVTDDPSQKIGIGSTVTFAKQGIRLIGVNAGVGSFGTQFIALADFGTASMFEWKCATSASIHEGAGAENFNIDMNGKTGKGISVFRAYNNSVWQNIRIYNVHDSYNAWYFSYHPSAGSTEKVSQGITGINLWGQHQNTTATAPTWFMQNLQECLFIGCKGFGGNGTTAAGGYCWEVRDCRGVEFYGCSAASADSGGWNVTSADHSTDLIVIQDCTFELLGTAGSANFVRCGAPVGTGTWSAATTYAVGDVVVDSVAPGKAYVSIQAGNLNKAPASNPSWWTNLQIQRLIVRAPRFQSPTSGKFQIEQGINCNIDSEGQSITLHDTSAQNYVFSTRPDLVTLGAGAGNTEYGTAFFQSGKIYAPTIGVTNTVTAVTGAVYLGSPTGTLIMTGTGSPAGVVVANPGSLFLRTDGGAGTTLYVKESLTTSSGWVAK